MDKFRPVETENKIDDQASSFNAQTNEDDPGNNTQAIKYEVVSFCHNFLSLKLWHKYNKNLLINNKYIFIFKKYLSHNKNGVSGILFYPTISLYFFILALPEKANPPEF